MKSILIKCLLCLLLVAGTAVGQEKIWVSSPGATLKANKSASSKTVAEVSMGTELTVISSEDRWYQVSTDSGKEGWIYRGKVSLTPPVQKPGKDKISLGGSLSRIPGGSIRADSSDTSRSIRGLSPQAKEYAQISGTKEQYQKALDTVLSMPTRSSEVEQFLKAGKIGEYAE